MKQLSLEWQPQILPLQVPIRTANQLITERQTLVLRLEAPDGLVGYGEVAPWPGTERWALEEARAWLARLRRGENLAQEQALALALERIAAPTPGARAARAAVETALGDLLSQREGIPLACWLQARARLMVPVNGLIGLADTEATVTAAQEAVGAGFTTLKLKVRLDLQEVERVEAVRASVGRQVRLRLDANGTAPAQTALQFARAIAYLDIEYLEQPVATLEELAWLRRRSPIPVAADEVLTGPEVIEQALQLEAADIYVCKIPLLGGLARVLALAERVDREGLDIVVTSLFESAVGLAAGIHVAAALPAQGERAHGLATGAWVAAPPELRPACGWLVVPSGPGLGIEPTERGIRERSMHAR